MPAWPFSKHARLRAARAVLERIGAQVDSGICVELWDQSVIPLGPHADPNLRVVLRSAGTISSLLRRPTLDNLVRHYAAGHVEFRGCDLVSFGEKAGPGFKTALVGLSKWWLARQAVPFLFHRGQHVAQIRHAVAGLEERRPKRVDDKKLIQFHYDLGNEFYQLILDPEMQYSCGYFRHRDNSLEQAQADKLEMVCRKLRLQPGERLLDVGCGWGGLLCYAARHYGVRGHGVTLSARQLEFAQEKIRRLGLEHQVTVELRSYQDLVGPYDKICSIGMMEHVGVANYPAYFDKLYALLSSRGILLNHAIYRGAKKSKRRFFRTRPEHSFVKKYIFPGGELGHIGHSLEVMEQSNFQIHDVEGWREHYARTLRCWCENLTKACARAEHLVGSETVRMWAAYLAGFSMAFNKGSLRLFQVVAVKRAGQGVPPVLPPTREDLYSRPFPGVAALARVA